MTGLAVILELLLTVAEKVRVTRSLDLTSVRKPESRSKTEIISQWLLRKGQDTAGKAMVPKSVTWSLQPQNTKMLGVWEGCKVSGASS